MARVNATHLKSHPVSSTCTTCTAEDGKTSSLFNACLICVKGECVGGEQCPVNLVSGHLSWFIPGMPSSAL